MSKIVEEIVKPMIGTSLTWFHAFKTDARLHIIYNKYEFIDSQFWEIQYRCLPLVNVFFYISTWWKHSEWQDREPSSLFVRAI